MIQSRLFSGQVLSRGGKAKGRYKHWYNVRRDDGTIQCVDFKESLRDLEEVPEDVEMIVFFNRLNDPSKIKKLKSFAVIISRKQYN